VGEKVTSEVRAVRDGLFSMSARRFGRVTEMMIRRMTGAEKPLNKFHDLYDFRTQQRVEVKFSRAERRHSLKITEDNVLHVIKQEGLELRTFPFSQWSNTDFCSVIQHVNTEEFDVLYYGMFFADCIKIFRAPSCALDSEEFPCNTYKSVAKERQIPLTPRTLPYHIENFHWRTLTYLEFIDIFSVTEGVGEEVAA
jgi:hypothetical protein